MTPEAEIAALRMVLDARNKQLETILTERNEARAESRLANHNNELSYELGKHHGAEDTRAEIAAQFSDEDVDAVYRHLGRVLGGRLLKVIRPEVE